MVFSWLPPAKAALFLLLSQMFAGFLLSIVFVQVSRRARLPQLGAQLWVAACVNDSLCQIM